MTIGIADLDLAGLPTPEALETVAYETILAERIADFQARFPDWDMGALETDPVMILLQEGVYREQILRERVNETYRQNLLAFATGGNLDQLAVFYDVARLADETDAQLRRRVVLAIAGRSPGGTADRYRSIALSADVRIADAVAWRDDLSPVVRVSVLSSVNNGVPYPEMLAAVADALAATDVQMVNDTITVEGAVKQTVNVAANVWMLPNAPQATFDGLEQALRNDWAAEGGLGRDLTVSWLTAKLMRPGVQKVQITAPASDVEAPFHDSIALGTITLTDKGRAY